MGLLLRGFGVSRVFWDVAERFWCFYGVSSVFWDVAERV